MKKIFTWYWRKYKGVEDIFLKICMAVCFGYIPIRGAIIIFGRNLNTDRFIILWFIFSICYPFICMHLLKK